MSKSTKKPLPPNLRLEKFEREARASGFTSIAGIDEAGRGPLAGPVVAAACILPAGIRLRGINDSKKLTAQEREALYARILNNPDIISGVGMIDVLMIDQINILRATLQAMIGAIAKLPKKPDFILVDGPHLPPTDIPGKAIIDGDTLSQSIMAAAIIAKCTRDLLMIQLHELYPQYNFKSHKGYGTPEHLEALKKYGPCPLHRQSFAPVREAAHA
ncbi:MAG: ribonuclease HII [Verrucomicrobia bacterium]|nr:ribonuclease HII [Verrucomicrobiota bacterium]